MPGSQVSNPQGAFGNAPVPDFRTGKDATGKALVGPTVTVSDYQSAGVIAKYDLVNLVPPSAAATNWQWKQNAAADADGRVYGIAQNATTAAGQAVTVLTYGPTLVNVGAGTSAADNFGVQSATAGQITPTAIASLDATVVNGQNLGYFGGAKDASNLALFFFNQH